ncbi:MAG: hypothetical protein DHS20C02_19590 [Micavibrio sp.]|nr:MAG: hypothetical protein DHS20C02_19590 [Micavibrio sp.]
MTNNKKSIIGVLVLVLPILVLAGMTGKVAIRQQVGEQIWRVKITGYDPRDLLYGHYLRFRYDWNIGANPHTSSASPKNQTCLCLNQSGDGYSNPEVYQTHCKAPENKSCQSVMKVYRHGNRYSLNRNEVSEKYFIPEENSEEIDRLFRSGDGEFSVELMAHKDHSVSVRKLYINDVPLDEYLRDMLKTSEGE